MSIQTRLIKYGDANSVYEGMLCWDDAATGARPGVLVSHTIRGRTAFEEGKARALAELGYVAFALDVYGASQLGAEGEVPRQNMEQLLANRPELQQRLSLSLQTLTAQPQVDAERVAAIGYCFGGLCVLDLARIGAPLQGVASFHGLFTPPGNTTGQKIDARILALHGWDDPLADPDSVIAVSRELTECGADWQLHAYGGTRHSFTNPAANDAERGTVYDAAADRRSWLAMQNFLHEILE